MLWLLVIASCCLAINAQVQEVHPAPEPYAFAYSAPNEDGSSSSREETGDANGRIVGFYTLLGEGGQQRRVDYVADENGFRASVATNEIGTESKNAADAEYLSSAPTAAELVAQYAASGAGRIRGGAGLVVGGAIRGVPRLTQTIAQAGLVRGPIVGGGQIVAGGPVLAVPPPVVAAAAPVVAAGGPLLAGGGVIGVQRGVVGPIGPIGGGIARFQAIRSGAGLVGLGGLGGLGGVSRYIGPIGGSIQRIETIRGGGLGLNGIGIGGLGGIAGLQGLQGLGGNLVLLPGSVGTGGVRLVSGGLGLQGLGLQGLGLQGLGLQGLGLQGLGIQGLQGVQRIVVPQGGLVGPTALSTEEITELRKKSK